MECEKCQDRGFTEENHGLIMVLCDCEAGRKKRAEIGLPEKEVDESGESLLEVAAEANALANALTPKLEGEDDSSSRIGQPVGKVVKLKEGEERLDVVAELTTEGAAKLEDIGIMANGGNDGDIRTERDNQPIGSADTGKSKQPKKQRAKRKARKRAS